MADEQDVFISGVSGSIAAWSTEATASKIAGTLKQISAQSASILTLLNAVKSGSSLSSKELSQIKGELRTNNKQEKVSQKADSTQSSQARNAWGRLSAGIQNMVSGHDNLADQIIKNQRETNLHNKKLTDLLKAGLNRDEAEKVLTGEKEKKNFEKMAAAASGVIMSIGGIEEATKVGFEQRFDMASELRQTGLMDGINGVNEGFISIAKTISSTGFTFGMAAEMTKDFAKTVGIVGVKSTLDFVESVARGPGGLMNKFALEFGQVVGISGEYLDSLRISGQLRGRSERELQDGMESFMSNVQATSNALKVTLEEAATILKNSLSDVERGMLLTLPKAMADSLRGAMSFAGGLNNPIGELLASRLGAGSEAMFQQTSQFQQMAGNALGQEMIQFVNEAAKQLQVGGDAQFQSFMSTQLPKFVGDELQRYGQGASRSLAFANDGEILQILAQLSPLAQNMAEAAQGHSGGTAEDRAMINYKDQQLQALSRGEGAMNSVMQGYITNLEKLTESNRATANLAADTIIANANLIDMANNAGTTIQRGGNLFMRGVLHFTNFAGNLLPGNNENVNFMSIDQYADRTTSGGIVADRGVHRSFKSDSSNLAEHYQDLASDGALTSENLTAAINDYKNLATQLMAIEKTDSRVPWGKDAAEQNMALHKTMEATLTELRNLLNSINQ
jgi:hypothetical protein